MTETPEEPTPKAPAKPKADPAGPSVRSVVFGTLAAAAVAGSAVAFAVGGWWALAGFGAAAAFAPAAARRIVHGPPKARKSPGLLGLGGSRKPGKSTGTGSLSWPFTGNQQRRALSKGTGGRSAGAGRTGRGKGLGLSGGRAAGLPSVTSKGRARKAAAAGRGASTGGALPKMKGARPVSRNPSRKHGSVLPTGKARPAVKASPAAGRRPIAAKAGVSPRTPSRTPSRPTARPRLTAAAKGTRRAPGAAGARGRVLPKLGAASRRRSVSPLSRSTGTRGRILPKSSAGRGLNPLSKSRGRVSPGAGLSRGRKLATGAPARKSTGVASKLGTRKRVPARVARRVPNRTMSRLQPARRGSVPRLVRTAIGVPKRDGMRLKRPAARHRRNARRSLVRATAVGSRRMVARAARWQWRGVRSYLSTLDQRARGLTAPVPIKIHVPATPPRTQRDIRRKYTKPYPQLTGRRADTPRGTNVSNPTESVIEAYSQFANFDPENATAIMQLLQDMPRMHEESAAALRSQAARFSDEQPIHAAVIDGMEQLAAAHAGLAELAQENYSVFASVHADDIKRLEEQRANEAAWDVSNNR